MKERLQKEKKIQKKEKETLFNIMNLCIVLFSLALLTACRDLDEVKILLGATSGTRKYFRTMHRIKYPRLHLALGISGLCAASSIPGCTML